MATKRTRGQGALVLWDVWKGVLFSATMDIGVLLMDTGQLLLRYGLQSAKA